MAHIATGRLWGMYSAGSYKSLYLPIMQKYRDRLKVKMTVTSYSSDAWNLKWSTEWFVNQNI
jgi:hypothetical protein